MCVCVVSLYSPAGQSGNRKSGQRGGGQKAGSRAVDLEPLSQV